MSQKTDLLGTVFLWGVFFILFFCNPISVLDRFHHNIHIFLCHFTARKQAGYFLGKLLSLLCTSGAIFLCGLCYKHIAVSEKLICSYIESFCELFCRI